MPDQESTPGALEGCGRGRRLFHWVAVIAVLLPVGIAMTGEGFGTWSDALYVTHKGLGSILGAVLVARLLLLRLFVRRRLLDPHDAADMRTWRGTGGFSLDGSVRVEAHDRAGLERLIRYCARPPFALHRLHAPTGQPSLRRPDARLLYRLTRPLADGRAALRLTPLELLGRLARLIPPPRAHRHRYHGALAPNARLRPDVVRYGRPHHELETLDALAAAPAPAPDDDGNGLGRSSSPARVRWAQLLARVYQLDPLRCPGCHGTLRILAFLTEPDVVEGILRHLGLPHRPPRIAPARAPPQAEIDFDQTPPWDRNARSSPPPLPQLDPFDQSLPGDDGTWSA